MQYTMLGHVLRSASMCSILFLEEVSNSRIVKVIDTRCWIECMHVTSINEIPAEVIVIVLVFVNDSVPEVSWYNLFERFQ